MTIFDMLEQSGVLTLLGMGVVFSFLIILVLSITGTGILIRRFAKPEAVKTASSARKPENGGEITAAIGAAVNQYKKNNK